jgi:hypothetical protein
LPYLGKAALAGTQAAQGVYDQATQDYMTTAKIAELKKNMADEATRKSIVDKLALTPEYANNSTKLAALQFAPKEALLEQLKGTDNNPFAKVDPKDYTRASFSKFVTTKNYADLVPAVSPNTNQDFSRSNELRSQIQALPEVKAWNVTQPLLLSARQAAKDTTGASDLNMIYALGKALDPNSVVREGELQMAGNTGSFGDRLKGLYKTVSSGGNLDPKVKQELLTQIESRTYAQKKQYDQVKNRYSSIARKYNLDPNDLFMDSIVEPVDISQMRAADTVTLSPQGQSVYNKYRLNGR